MLVKFLFTTENLSVQVHPDDRLARELGHLRGKTEMWHILRCEPGAKVAIGFLKPVTEEQVRSAAADGSIMDLLRWIPVTPGQTWFLPAGIVHAIGAGITLCEVQQNSDLTYRLFDYGRGRALHLEESLRAMNCAAGTSEPITAENGVVVDCPYFQVNAVNVGGQRDDVHADLIVVLDGIALLNGQAIKAGETWKVDRNQALSLKGNARLLTVLTRT